MNLLVLWFLVLVLLVLTSNGSDSISINEGNVSISAACQVYISATEDDFVHLILNNMSITSNNG